MSIAAPIAMPAVNPIRPAATASAAAFLLNDHRGRRRGVDGLRVVLRNVDDLRVGRLDHDHLLAARRGPGLDLLLRRGLELPGILRLDSQPLDAGEDRRAIGGERLAEPGRPVQISRHRVHDLRKEDEGHEARLEARLRRRILKLAAFQRLAGEPFAERRHLAGIGGTEKHLREQLIRIEGDGREQAVERVGRRGRLGSGRGRASALSVGSTAVNPCGAARPSHANTSKACVLIASVFMRVMAPDRPKESDGCLSSARARIAAARSTCHRHTPPSTTAWAA